jgi:beta-glucanase (GH16 family)
MRTKATLIFPAMCATLLFCLASVANAAEGPFGGTPVSIPGTVMAENYDTGGQGVGYNVTSINGTANAYRSDGVDLQKASAPATGNNLGWAAAGQWFRYTVNVATAGTYKINILVAAAAAADAFHISNSAGTNLSGSVAVPATGGFQVWKTVTATVTLPAGVQTLTLDEDAPHWNIDSFAFTETTPVPPQPPTGLTATAISSSQINLSWTASTTAGVEYNVLQDGNQIATVSATTYANTGLAASTTYTYKVEATNSAGISVPDGPVTAMTLSGGGGTGNCAGVSNIVVSGITYTPTWCQEFNGAVGSAIDTTVWNFDLGNNGGWGNGEAEVYCGPPGYPGNPAQCPTTFSTATAPVYIDGNGHLAIRPIKENGAWLSGRMNTQGKQNFTYGILEASVQLPNTTNQGLWAAFWTLGSNIGSVGWPTCGEEDILEDWSPQVHNGAGTTGDISTAHTKDTGGNGKGARYTFPSGEAGNTAFHTYGIVWTQNSVKTFVDNPSAPFENITPGSLPAGDTWPFNQDMFTILNVAVGGTLGGSDAGLASPAQPMLVDYVRWYTAQ